jgi:UDP-glucose 4-epimerase
MALYLVTGGAGFIGSHLVHALVERGDRARVLDDLSSGRRSNLAPLEVGEAGSGAPVELLEGDVADPDAAGRACEGVRGVFHEAALVSVPRSVEEPEESFRINVRGTFQLLEGARRGGAEGFVLASSSAVYGMDEELPKRESMTPQPASPYAGDKLTGETMLGVWGRVYGLNTTSLRYFNVYGPRQADDSPYSGVIALFARSCLARTPVTIFGDGEQTRDFVFVEDVVRANLAAMDGGDAGGGPGRVFNVGTGSRVSINELYREIAARTGMDEPASHGPARAGDVRHSQASIEAARSGLGFEPRVPWAEGLSRTMDWYRGEGE